MRKSCIFVIILLLLIIITPVSAWKWANPNQSVNHYNAIAGQTVCDNFDGDPSVDHAWFAVNGTAPWYLNGNTFAAVPRNTCMPMWGNVSTMTFAATKDDYYLSRIDIYHLVGGGLEITPICDFEILPYPADPGTVITLTDTSTGGEPTGYGWGYQIPGGSWDNTSLGIGETASYTLAYFGQYNFSHEVGNSAGTDTCWYPYWSGTNYTAWNVTPTIVGNLTTNITATNISGQFAPLNLTLIDKSFFKNQLDNMTFFGNYSSAWTGFIDNMTESVNVTFNEVENRINPFNFLTDLIMNSHNLFVVIFIPLLGYVSFPLVITSAVINIIPEPIQLLISLGLLVDLFFLVLRGPD